MDTPDLLNDLCFLSSVRCKSPDKGVLNFELKKLSGDAKRELARKLLAEAHNEDSSKKNHIKHSYQDSEFDNPFSTRPPAMLKILGIPDGVMHAHKPCLKPDKFVTLKLLSVKPLGEMVAEYTFALPQAIDYTACVPGDTADFSGPCGGYKYQPNSTSNLTLLATGMSCQPAIQIVREIMANPSDLRISPTLRYQQEQDIPYRKELQKYPTYDKRMKASFTVSEVDCDDWEGGEGYIDSNLLSSMLPPAEESSHRVLVCGGPRMVMGVLQGLRGLGYSSEKIFVYGQLGVQQIRTVYGKFAELAQHRETNNNINGYYH